MELIRISYSIADLIDGQTGGDQKLGSFGHTVFDQILLGSLSDLIFEKFEKAVAVDIASCCDRFHGDIIHKVFFNI